ncbi:hypothetical protein NHH03_13240 [Stieleria sp. TO1_6]|uniref:hypothetical protein n=1 Tax=Stieleria tagensis TaxID=2956795 RepID=UPI00209B48A3|nr:hypothetical protein [Stieleria tagensis]MCO8122706.1 hypothetical protein [Stieleria tagensis]
MRFQQIIAAVTRSLNLKGVREILSVDSFARATDLSLCMACVSPTMGRSREASVMLVSYQCHPGRPEQPAIHRWQPAGGITATGKRKRLPATARLLGMAKRGAATLNFRDC